ncbi:MAG: DUF1972 domain-containing protein [Bacteroidota bacterium]
MKRKRIGIIGTVGVPARYGGFETLAHQLVLNLNKDFDLTVYNSTQHYSAKERVKKWNGADIRYIPLKANGVQSIFYDMISMIHAVIFCDVMLILGVSGCLFLPFIKLFFPFKRVIVNIDGLEWRRAKWGSSAKHFLSFSEKIAIWFADEIVADNAAIQKYVYDRYGVSSNLIEYGADHNQVEDITEETYQKFPFLRAEYAFKVARIEPENHIHTVVEAFARQTELPLVLVGNWDVNEYGKALREKYEKYDHLYLLDPIYEANLLNQLRSNAKLYVHGHSMGGTNPSLVEAMYLGLPILSYDVVYNKVTTERKAYYFEDVEQLGKMIKFHEVLDLDRVSRDLYNVAYRRYRWSVITNKYAALATGTAEVPSLAFDFELPKQLQEVMN